MINKEADGLRACTDGDYFEHGLWRTFSFYAVIILDIGNFILQQNVFHVRLIDC